MDTAVPTEFVADSRRHQEVEHQPMEWEDEINEQFPAEYATSTPNQSRAEHPELLPNINLPEVAPTSPCSHDMETITDQPSDLDFPSWNLLGSQRSSGHHNQVPTTQELVDTMDQLSSPATEQATSTVLTPILVAPHPAVSTSSIIDLSDDIDMDIETTPTTYVVQGPIAPLFDRHKLTHGTVSGNGLCCYLAVMCAKHHIVWDSLAAHNSAIIKLLHELTTSLYQYTVTNPTASQHYKARWQDAQANPTPTSIKAATVEEFIYFFYIQVAGTPPASSLPTEYWGGYAELMIAAAIWQQDIFVFEQQAPADKWCLWKLSHDASEGSFGKEMISSLAWSTTLASFTTDTVALSFINGNHFNPVYTFAPPKRTPILHKVPGILTRSKAKAVALDKSQPSQTQTSTSSPDLTPEHKPHAVNFAAIPLGADIYYWLKERSAEFQVPLPDAPITYSAQIMPVMEQYPHRMRDMLFACRDPHLFLAGCQDAQLRAWGLEILVDACLSTIHKAKNHYQTPQATRNTLDVWFQEIYLAENMEAAWKATQQVDLWALMATFAPHCQPDYNPEIWAKLTPDTWPWLAVIGGLIDNTGAEDGDPAPKLTLASLYDLVTTSDFLATLASIHHHAALGLHHGMDRAQRLHTRLSSASGAAIGPLATTPHPQHLFI